MLNHVVTGGFTVRRIASLTVAAALTGYGTGECYRNLKAHSGTGKRIIGYSVIGGAAGAIFGTGLGIYGGRGTLVLMLSQSMYGSLITACYCNIHSTLVNKKLKLPGQVEQLKTTTISTITGGITGGLLGLVPGLRVLTMFSIGTVVGFVGHYMHHGLEIIRLEFLINENYPELAAELKESEEWIEDQCQSNPYYVGPVKEKPSWLITLGSLWGDFGKNTEEKRKRFESS